ncbi:LOW QUALITY PROTEIN: helicase with zinc finger domain 2-like [Pomacea canaliculata]|uniref:LOW QUALITY PROTEIN: helicase with zinc finger domain 2-like n=1 Tax=Pomacea canaliculata TaxID=400727 RepID=UPI000D725511|nr:LOW QUALITY PROTEIN: helicase with zinc finger domain 2-like [Pomacea canaliculata]
MDDEVVVEVLTEPGQARRLQGKEIPGQESESVVEKMAHGCVVGMYPSRRVRFRDVEHPVLICTQDEIEGHLMKPLCKTVPKIHVMNDKVKEKYPALTKHRLEIKKIVNGKVEFKRFLDVDPDKREQYVFKVVILSWRVQSIYPLGAILEAHIGGKDFGSGLQVLTLQHNAPGVYPRKVIHETQALKLEDFPQRTGRLDLTSKRIVTIDPPGSQDLDDALNISKEQSGFVVGIHIADVASFVKVGTAIDEEAKRRAFTFYPGERKPRPMFPEPLSHGVLSLLPGQERLALSVFFRFDKKGNLKTNEEPRVKKTIIKSTRQFSYEEIQKVIDGDQHINVDQDTRMDVLDLHMIASQLREARIGKGGLFVPFEDPRLHDIDSVADSLQAHSLVEEFMVLANKSIAKRLRQKFPHVMILRSHKPPTYEQLAEWREKEGNIANLVMQLQGKKTSPSTKLSVSAGVQGHDMFPQNRHVIVQEHLYHRICECLEEENLDEARRLLFMDALHPLQCLAYQHWMEMMETAEYKCSHGLNQPDHYHFGLDIEYYTHFTSPIRRYVDLHVHRLLHADLDGKAPDCKAEDVVRLCQHLNNVDARQKAFGRGCRALAIAEKLQTNPLVFRAFVDNVDSEQLIFCLPSLLSVSDRKQEVSFSMLGVSSQPKVITDTVQKKDMATVCWETRLYNQHGTSSRELVVKRKYVEREAYQNHVPSSVPIDIPINPNQLTVNVSQKEWAGMLRLLMDSNCTELPDIPAVIERVRSEVDHISSENGDGQYQCAEFASALSVLSRSARASIRSQKIESYKEYRRAWMPLLEMEAAYGAGTGDSAFGIDNVKIEMKYTLSTKSSKQQGFYQGTFSLPAKFCFDRGIEFGGKSAGSTGKEVEYKNSSTCPMDYLCIRCRVKCEEPIISRVQQSCLKCVVDDHYTWISHGGVVAVTHKNRKDSNGGHLQVSFVLSPHSSVPPSQLMSSTGHPVMLEVLPKSQVDSVSLIQGPPGTGKTYTGIKLIYLFTKINRKLLSEGKGKKVILFCGPSNKSVDLVARLLKLKFGNECPKNELAWDEDLTSDPELKDVSLHHIIRESDKPYAEKIAAFERYFDKCRKDPENFKVTSKQMRTTNGFCMMPAPRNSHIMKSSSLHVLLAAVQNSLKLQKALYFNALDTSLLAWKFLKARVIIDECAMSPEPHSLVPIVANKAKQVVLIGDHKQLRPIITCQAAAELGLDQSLFERLYLKSSVKCIFLSTQYRMHPEICAFPSNEFYEGKLQSSPITTRSKFILPIWPLHPQTSEPVPHILVDVRGEEETLTVSTDEGNERSKSNFAEADKVIEILTYLKYACEEKKKEIEMNSRNSESTSYSIKVLTQYNAQRHLLEEKLSKACEGHRHDTFTPVLTRYDKNNITISTVVSSQGGEWDYVVLSTVRSLPSYKIEPHPTLGWCRQNMGFITDQNQVNVALTRARRGLIIVGNAELLKCDPVWSRLVTRYEKLGCVFESANFPPPVLPRKPKAKPHRKPAASLDWQQA